MLAVLSVFCLFAAGATLEIKKRFQEFRKRAAVSEIKIAFAAIYGAEKSYFSEYATYSASFKLLRFESYPRKSRSTFAVGFPGACWKKWGLTEENACYIPITNLAPELRLEVRRLFQNHLKAGDCPSIELGFELLAAGSRSEE